jgi:cytochrome c oxidase subunit 2
VKAVRLVWCLLFFLVPVMAVGLFLLAPIYGWWLPEALSTIAADIDRMFYVILGITGVIFVITQVWLLFALVRFSDARRARADYFHENVRLELIWSIIPAGILVFMALYQVPSWGRAKFVTQVARELNAEEIGEVVGTQFDWRFRSVGLDGKPGRAGVDDDRNGIVDDWEELLFPDTDDLETVGEMHVPVGQPVLIRLRSRDVLHSFFVPEFRLKQDAVPGMTIPVWFQATREGTYEVVCAELCGWGHYRMRARLVLENRDQFRKWLQEENRKEEQSR